MTTNELGAYTLRNCEAGPTIVTVQAEGFGPEFQEVRSRIEERWRRR